MSRDPKQLSPEMLELYELWSVQMAGEGIDYILTCTRRLQSEQNDLYAQGRTRPGLIVTWTLTSKHLTGDAFDFVIMVNGKPDWKMAHMDLWSRAVEIAKSLGLTQVVNSKGKVMEYAHLQRAA